MARGGITLYVAHVEASTRGYSQAAEKASPMNALPSVIAERIDLRKELLLTCQNEKALPAR